MNCPTCKNPNKTNATQCEWCGFGLTPSNQNAFNSKENIINITISFDGTWFLIDSKVKLFADDILVGSGSIINGFHIEFTVSKTYPIIKIKHSLFRSQILKIPKLELGGNYEIIISYDRWLKGNFNSKPVRIITN